MNINLKQLLDTVNQTVDKLENNIKNYIKDSKIKKDFDKLTTVSSFKKTLLISLALVFLFYLPFTIATLIFDRIVFFQLDHLFQYSTLVFDFRNRIYTMNFSTWDWKNAMGYDYFANFYYIPVDFSFLPFLLLPFVSFHKLMWLSFLLKILVGSAAFAYLLKLYKLSHKTIIFTTFIYGTADLFFAQNVFPSFTGLIAYIPLLLIGVELIIQKRHYLVFTLVIAQMFLFNFYWSWPLSLFMAAYLFVRLLYANFSFGKTLSKLFFSILAYLLGVGLAAFFLLPIIGIMKEEPRMGESFQAMFGEILQLLVKGDFKTIQKVYFEFPKIVYFKTLFKTLVPNLFAYNGYFYDRSDAYFLPTNHVIIYSSILATFTVFQFILQPIIAHAKQLTPKQFKNLMFLKWTTIITFILMFIPLIAYLFSAAQTAYLRWFVFFGVLLIINFAFLYEYKLINKYFLLLFLLISSAFLAWSNYYNDLPEIYNDGFHATDETSSYTMIIVYGISFLFLILFFKTKYSLQFIVLFEKIGLIVLIFTLLMPEGYSYGVRHHSVYGKEMNALLKNIENRDDYKVTNYFLYYNDLGDMSPMQNLAYLNNYGGYNNDSTFHSLINPYYKMRNDTIHYRSYVVPEMQYFYYRYLDPSQFIISSTNKGNGKLINGMYGLDSELVASKVIEEFDSTIRIYQKEPDLALGVGFTKFYDISKSAAQYNYMWLDALYIKEEEEEEDVDAIRLADHLKALGFESVKGNMNMIHTVNVDRNKVTEIDLEYASGLDYYSNMKFKEIPVDITRDETNTVLTFNTTIKVLIAKDFNDQMVRCFNTFCNVPDTGIKSLIVGVSADSTWDAKNTTLYTVDKALEAEKIADLNQYKTYDVKIDGNTITSKVTNDQPVIMNYKIGYAPGWKVLVDGEAVDTFKGHGGLLSFTILDSGEHNIVLQYETPLLNTGLKISKLSLGIFILLAIVTLAYKPIFKLIDFAVLYGKERNFNIKTITTDLTHNKHVQEFVRFVIIGVIATLIHYVFYTLFLNVADKNIALIVAYVISFFFNFFASNLFTFKTKPDFQGGYRFIIAHAVNLLNQLILLNLFTFFGLNEKLAIIPTYLITIPLNFLFVRYALKSK